MKKFFLKSKIFNVSASGGVIFLLDAAHSFLVSPTLDNLCAQKSALAAGLFLAVSVMRAYFTSDQLTIKRK